MAGNAIIECYRRDLVPAYCQGYESSAVYNAPHFFIKSVRGHSNRSPPHLPLHVHAEDIGSTFLTSNIYMGM